MHITTLSLAGLALSTLAACGGETKPAAEVAAAPVAPPVITITAKDYVYEAPDTVTGGVVTITLVNQGPELHHIQFLHLTDGKKAADLEAYLKAMKPGDHMPAWAHDVAGPNTPVPGGTSSLTQDLAPGEYAIICMIPSPDGVPHAMKGMIRALTVLPPTGAVAALPTADVNVRMLDYAWEITPAITAGKHTLRIENGAEQSHEIFLAQLAPGKTAMDLAAWAEKPQGPPPGTPLGGTSAMAKGGVAFLTVDLAPGEYGLYCFLPDMKDGKPHLVHGMVKQITVQ
jgi:uncharacterized cupredoxin-like copper-binding protein